MRRFLVLVLAVLVLAGCASRAASNPPAGTPGASTPSTPPSTPPAVHHHSLFARPDHPITPVATVSVGRAHRVNVREVGAARPRRHSINCAASGAARSTVRIAFSPADSQPRICLPVGGTLTVATPHTPYHCSRPQLAGDRGVLRPSGRLAGGTLITYRAAGRGVAQLQVTASPPAGSLAPAFEWLATVVVR